MGTSRAEEVHAGDDHVGVGVGELVGACLRLVLVDEVAAVGQLDRAATGPGFDIGADATKSLVDQFDRCLRALPDIGERAGGSPSRLAMPMTNGGRLLSAASGSSAVASMAAWNAAAPCPCRESTSPSPSEGSPSSPASVVAASSVLSPPSVVSVAAVVAPPSVAGAVVPAGSAPSAAVVPLAAHRRRHHTT